MLNDDIDELPDLDVDIPSLPWLRDCHTQKLDKGGSLATSCLQKISGGRRSQSGGTATAKLKRSDFISIESGDEEEKDDNELKLLSLARRLAGGTDDDNSINNNNKSKCAEHNRVHDSFDSVSRYSNDNPGLGFGTAVVAETSMHRRSSVHISHEHNHRFSETVAYKSKHSAFVSVESADEDDGECKFLPLASRIAGFVKNVEKNSKNENVILGACSHEVDNAFLPSYSIGASKSSVITSYRAGETKSDKFNSETCLDDDLHHKFIVNDYTAVIDKKERQKAPRNDNPKMLVQKTAPHQKKEQLLNEKEFKKQQLADAKRKREEMKLEQEFEKTKKRILQESLRRIKPGECMKNISLGIDLRLVNEPCGSSILEQLQSSGVKYEVVTQVLPYIITFWRSEIVVTETEPRKLATSYKDNIEKDVLLYVPLPDFLQMVDNFHKEKQGMALGACSVTQFAISKRQLLNNCTLTLLVMGIQAHYRNLKTGENRAFRQRVKNVSSSSSVPPVGSKRKKTKEEDTVAVGQLEVEEALLHLQIESGICPRFVESSAELAKFVLQFTKAIAQRPFKFEQMKSAGFNMFMEGSRGVRVLPDGTGLTNVWRQQIQQFKNVSVEVANAIVAIYPTPRALYNAYKKCSSAEEGASLLEDIVVRRGAGIMATTRRVGKELSRKIHIFMTSSDPNQIIK